ncbi:MAG: methyltransferase domain-containing protein [Boseongicola sp.]
MKTHEYSDGFFDYIDEGARSSAQELIRLVGSWVEPDSVLDLGSGRGVWLAEWLKAGALEVVGVDGDYVDRTQIVIPAESFIPADLTKPQDLGRNFDLAQSLEVGEHLPESASSTLVGSLTHHSNRVLFSAAVPGQGGEFHINEKPLEYWRQLFKYAGYFPFDCVRPLLKNAGNVEPWYRYNTILYMNEDGMSDMPDEVLDSRIPDGTAVPHLGSISWRLRKTVVSLLPRNAVTMIATSRASLINRKNRR